MGGLVAFDSPVRVHHHPFSLSSLCVCLTAAMPSWERQWDLFKQAVQLSDWKSLSFAVLVAVAAICSTMLLAAFVTDEVILLLENLSGYIINNLPISLLFVVLFFTGTSGLFIPAEPFAVGLGYTFGLFWGFIVFLLCCFTASLVLFQVGRTIARP